MTRSVVSDVIQLRRNRLLSLPPPAVRSCPPSQYAVFELDVDLDGLSACVSRYLISVGTMWDTVDVLERLPHSTRLTVTLLASRAALIAAVVDHLTVWACLGCGCRVASITMAAVSAIVVGLLCSALVE